MTTLSKPVRIVFLGAGGSTGKTTEVVNVACELARRGKKVRIWDGDGQGDASQYFHHMEPPFVISDVLGEFDVYPDPDAPKGKRPPTMREIEVPVFRESLDEAEELGGIFSADPDTAAWLQRITLIPSGIGPSGSTLGDAITSMERDPMGHDRVLSALNDIDTDRPAAEIPDIEFFDLHGTVGTMSYLALRWAAQGGNENGKSGVTLVATPDDKATGRHYKEAFDIIEKVSRYHDIEPVAVIPARIRSKAQGKFYADMYARLQENEQFGHLVTPSVRESVYAAESFAAREPLLIWVPNEEITADQVNVVDWLVKNEVVRA